MTTKRRVDQLRGAARAASDATRAVTHVVEDMHQVIGGGPAVLGRPLAPVTRAVSAPAYSATRAVTAMLGSKIDAALAALSPMLDGPAIERGPLIAVLNGVVGDYLERTGNALATQMRVCAADGAAIEPTHTGIKAAFPRASGRVLVLVHGSSADESAWQRGGHSHGEALARDGGYSPVYVRYNSGRHISTNGGLLARLLEELVAAWPRPVDELVLLGHSMGGLVLRSACHTAESAGYRWREAVSALATLGTPHHGAPLERAGAVFEALLTANRYSAPLARLGMLRSAGVTDLRYGNLVDSDWRGRARFGTGGDARTHVPLPEGVRCFAVAGTSAASARKRLPGDGLVPVSSALGYHRDEARRLAFPAEHQLVVYSANHVDLFARDEVFQFLRRWLGSGATHAPSSERAD